MLFNSYEGKIRLFLKDDSLFDVNDEVTISWKSEPAHRARDRSSFARSLEIVGSDGHVEDVQ